jgi:hypothetical protein
VDDAEAPGASEAVAELETLVEADTVDVVERRHPVQVRL